MCFFLHNLWFLIELYDILRASYLYLGLFIFRWRDVFYFLIVVFSTMPCTRRKTLEVSLKVSSTQSHHYCWQFAREKRDGKRLRVRVCTRMCGCAECVRRADFIVHVVRHQCEIWGWFQTHDKAISNWITDFSAHNKMHLPRRFPKPRKGI